MTNYNWKGFSKNYSKDTALVRIKVNSVNYAPFVVDSKINGIEDQIINFSRILFTQNFIEVANNSLNKIKIISLPSHGTLKLKGGNSIKINQEISLLSLEKLEF